ncbi:MAG: hypothetical protein SFV52_16610 [Saprospiraceae bacterium]|nr:hypothetical protein [Saprospiraceae bacterium]
MSSRISYAELVKSATELDSEAFEAFLRDVRRQRATTDGPRYALEELTLLKKINRGFPNDRWLRLQLLDSKMEESTLTEQEYQELATLVNAYERYTLNRIRWIKKLASLRNISAEEAMAQIGYAHGSR